MRLFMIILVSAIIVLAIYFLVHRTMINRATLMLRRQAQATTDAAMAYALKVTELNAKDIELALNAYAKEKHLDYLPSAPKTFVVTDWWTYEQMLHVDVAYIYNEATREYVMDLHKLNQNN